MSDVLLYIAQTSGLSMIQWLNQNPFMIILLITFALLAVATFVRPSLFQDPPQEQPQEQTIKTFSEVLQESKSTPKAPTKSTAQPTKPTTKLTTKAAKPAPEVPVEEPTPAEAPPAAPVTEQVSEPGEEAEVAPTKVKPTPVAEEPPVAEEIVPPTPEPAKVKEEKPEAIEVKPEVAEAKPKAVPAPEEKVEPPKAPVAKETAPTPPKPVTTKPEAPPTEEDLERLQKVQERKLRRELHVSEMELKDEPEVAPRTLREGLERTRKGWVSVLGDMLRGKKELDDNLLEDLEELLFSADIGTRTVQRLLQTIEQKLERNELRDPSLVKDAIKDEIYKIINLGEAGLDFSQERPFVVMVVGVNGVGKTTTIGKITARLSLQGNKVLVAAADTFRAAAVEQLELWAKRTDAQVIRGQENQDPSSVVFDAVQAGVARGVDVIIADTAGRLHTKQNLMEELRKIKRVMARACASAPHEVLLVLDATMGQNAISQAKQFHEALGITGLVLTKLDGTAKGGVVVAICEELKIPIRYIGVGEHMDELKKFSPSDFVEALF